MPYDNQSVPTGVLWSPAIGSTIDWTTQDSTGRKQTSHESLTMDSSIPVPEQVVVLRTFDISLVVVASDDSAPSSNFTGEDVWKLWTLPLDTGPGSNMYTISNDSTIVMSDNADDYLITLADGIQYKLPIFNVDVHAVHVLRRTYSQDSFVDWESGSRITTAQLSHSFQQITNLIQEAIVYDLNRGKLDPYIDQAMGVCSLDSSGFVPNANIGPDTFDIHVSGTITGDGTVLSPLSLNTNDSLIEDGTTLKVDPITVLTSDSATQALAASQGKALKGEIDLLGTGVIYKGVVNVAIASTLGTPTAGWTVHALADTDPTHSDFGGGLDVNAGDMLRYGLTAWELVPGGSASLTADGAVDLNAGATLDLDAGTAVLVPNVSYPEENTKAANTAYVQAMVDVLQVEDLSDVDLTGVAAGSIIKSDGDGTWSLDNTVVRDAATGLDSLVLDNIANINAPTPSDNDQLTYHHASEKWINTVVATASVVTTIADAADSTGAGVSNTQMVSVWDAANLGHTGPGTAADSTINILDFTSATYLLGSTDHSVAALHATTTVYNTHKSNITYRNGNLQWKGTVAAAANAPTVMIREPNEAVTTKLSDITGTPRKGATIIDIADITDLKEGMVISIEPKDDSVMTNAYERMFDDGSSTPIYGKMVTTIRKILPGTKLLLSSPLEFSLQTSATYTIRATLYDSTDKTQPERLAFENMEFENLSSRYWDLGGNPINTNVGAGTEDEYTVTIPEDHGFTVVGTKVNAYFDSIKLTDMAQTVKFSDINRQTYDASAVTGFLEFKSGTDLLSGEFPGDQKENVDAAALGGALGCLGLGNETGLHFKNASKLVFKNCTFTGWKTAVLLERCVDVLFDNCTFISDPLSGTGADTAGIKISNCNGIKVRDCTFVGCCYGVLNSSSALPSYNITVRDCTATDILCLVYASGLQMRTTITNNTVSSRSINKRRHPWSVGVLNASNIVEIKGNYITIENNKFTGTTDFSEYASEATTWDNTVGYGTVGVGEDVWLAEGGISNWPADLDKQTVLVSRGMEFNLRGMGTEISNVLANGEADGFRQDKFGIDAGSETWLSINNNDIECWDKAAFITFNAGTPLNRQNIGRVTFKGNNIKTNRHGIVYDIGNRNSGNSQGIYIDNNEWHCDTIMHVQVPSKISSSAAATLNDDRYQWAWGSPAAVTQSGTAGVSNPRQYMHWAGPRSFICIGCYPDMQDWTSPDNKIVGSSISNNTMIMPFRSATHTGQPWHHVPCLIGNSQWVAFSFNGLRYTDNISWGGYSQSMLGYSHNTNSACLRRGVSDGNFANAVDYNRIWYRYNYVSQTYISSVSFYTSR